MFFLFAEGNFGDSRKILSRTQTPRFQGFRVSRFQGSAHTTPARSATHSKSHGNFNALSWNLKAFGITIYSIQYYSSSSWSSLNAERFEKLQILIADFELGIGAERACGDQGGVVGRVFALFADADGCFENEEDVVTAFLDARYDFRDRFESDRDSLIASPSSFMSCFSC